MSLLSVGVHFVWGTKGREPWIDPAWQEELYAYIGGIVRKKRALLLGAGGMPDHVHLYVALPATQSMAQLVNAIKANSSRWVHGEFPDLEGCAWQHGYAAFAVCKSAEAQLHHYLARQALHHRRHDFENELTALLDKHEIPYDRRYLLE